MATMFDVLDQLEITHTGQPGHILCPLHDEDTPSLMVWDDHWYCFGCSKGGNARDLVYALHGDRGVEEMQSQDLTVARRTAPPRPLLDAAGYFETHGSGWDEEHFALIKRRWPYLNVPMVRLAAANRVRPIDEGLAFVHHNAGRPVGIKIKHFNGKVTSVPGSQYPHLWSSCPIVHRRLPVIVCEGEPDCLALSQYTRSLTANVLSLPSGAGVWKPAFLDDVGELVPSRVWVCTDNDRAGDDAADRIIRSFRWGADRLELPGLYKDAADALHAGWKPDL
jgi:hypothetical protein